MPRLKAVFVYGEPILIEHMGLIFERNIGENVIVGESVEKDGFATKLVEFEIDEDELVSIINELSFGDIAKGVGAVGKVAGGAIAQKVGGVAQAVKDKIGGAVGTAAITAKAAKDTAMAIANAHAANHEIENKLRDSLGNIFTNTRNLLQYYKQINKSENPRLHSTVLDAIKKVGGVVGGDGINLPTWKLIPTDPTIMKGLGEMGAAIKAAMASK